MISVIRRHLGVADRERGSALVAAVAVALIGIALATVVVSASISLAQDSGEDRARTSSIHTAEGGIDAAYAELETWTNKKYALQIAGNELSRARGGPRCMTMPLEREEL